VEKTRQEKANMDVFQDQQKMQSLVKQEMRKLKEQDLMELQTHQKRIKLQQKVKLATKKIHLDEIKQAETIVRNDFIKRVQ